MTTTISTTPGAVKHTMPAGGSKILPGIRNGDKLTVQIPTGSTINVFTTASTSEEVNASTAEWFAWPHGSSAGPLMDTLLYPCTAVKFTGSSGAVFYTMKG